ncbi:MAG: hypothetical protein ACOCZK_03335 [Planctomycetota bacterium]
MSNDVWRHDGVERARLRECAAMTPYERLVLHEQLLEAALAIAGPKALERPNPDRDIPRGSTAYRHLST